MAAKEASSTASSEMRPGRATGFVFHRIFYCWGWAGHLAWCTGRGQGGIVGVPDDGNAAQRLAIGILSDVATAPAARKIFYIDPVGLHVIDNPRP